MDACCFEKGLHPIVVYYTPVWCFHVRIWRSVQKSQVSLCQNVVTLILYTCDNFLPQWWVELKLEVHHPVVVWYIFCILKGDVSASAKKSIHLPLKIIEYTWIWAWVFSWPGISKNIEIFGQCPTNWNEIIVFHIHIMSSFGPNKALLY